MTALILATLLLALLACWLWYGLEEPEAEVTPRWLWEVIHREEMDQHPAERPDYGVYRRRRLERGQR